MADRARSDDRQVQEQLDRLATMTSGEDRLGRDRLRRLLARLGNPERHLPPVFHVTGTNGKGSTCAFLRGALEAAGHSVHAYSSPHLVRLNERIRLAGKLIADRELAQILSETLDAVDGDETTFFEATTAAAFLAFARTKADACVIEVGIGGRHDATNVIPNSLVCGIAQIGLDHQRFLGATMEEIAADKAGICRRGVPLVTMRYPPTVAARVAAVAGECGAPLVIEGTDWSCVRNGQVLRFADRQGHLDLPLPALAGDHQIGNAGLAIAMLRCQQAFSIADEAMASALENVKWRGRLDRLRPGPLTRSLPQGSTIWIDGAHNVAAMEAVVAFMREQLSAGQKLQVVFALLEDKDATGVIGCFDRLQCEMRMVPIEGYECRSPEELARIARGSGIAASAAAGVEQALSEIGASAGNAPPQVLITGSLYLAGAVLRLNGELPD